MTALRAPGRPKDLEKREAILDAARSLFAERGIDGAPIEAIAARSGVSKVTVYGHFGDKQAIFDALIARELERVSQRIGQATETDGTLEQRLIGFGEELISSMTEPCHLALDRTVALESQRNPELGRRFFANGPGRVHDIMAALLADAQARQEIGAGDPAVMSQDLMSLWFGYQAIERRFCGGCSPDADDLRSRVSHAVRLFLRAYAPT
jgi:TetR/AcrR family transcriptional repressor of mexJK operon